MGRKRGIVCGVGVNDYPLPTSTGGKHIPEYKMWVNMLFRSHGTTFKEKHPTYQDVTCDVRWYSLNRFIEDVKKIPNYDKALYDGWCLDKDILVKGNKVYSETTCCFVPPIINGLVLTNKAKRGEHLIGTSYSKHAKKFRAYLIDTTNKQQHLGYFEDEYLAFLAYADAKQKQIKEVVQQFNGIIADNVREALLQWEVSSDD